MVPIGSISAIEARLAAIRQRLSAPGTPTAFQVGMDLTSVNPDPASSGFDPFGEVYQAAVERARSSVPASTSSFGAARYVGGPQGTESMTGGSGSSVGRIGGFGPMPVPSELQAYGNGRIPNGVLQPIGQGGHQLYAPAAEAWQQAVQAAAADGISLSVTDSYRTYDQQVDLVDRKGLYSQGGYGAEPGTSNHGWGLAVDADVTDPATLSWLRTNGYRFGFVEAVPREPWHWEFRPTQA
jgi:zinc D-Ala-D-Ala carboxypeptidase